MNATQTASALVALYGVITTVGHAVPATKIGKICLAIGANLKALLAAIALYGVGADLKALLAAIGKPAP